MPSLLLSQFVLSLWSQWDKGWFEFSIHDLASPPFCPIHQFPALILVTLALPVLSPSPFPRGDSHFWPCPLPHLLSWLRASYTLWCWDPFCVTAWQTTEFCSVLSLGCSIKLTQPIKSLCVLQGRHDLCLFLAGYNLCLFYHICVKSLFSFIPWLCFLLL